MVGGAGQGSGRGPDCRRGEDPAGKQQCMCAKAKCNHWRVLSRELIDEVYHSGECIEEQIYSKKCEVLFRIYFSIPISPNYTGVLLFSKLQPLFQMTLVKCLQEKRIIKNRIYLNSITMFLSTAKYFLNLLVTDTLMPLKLFISHYVKKINQSGSN